jgi:hypothetical protein
VLNVEDKMSKKIAFILLLSILFASCRKEKTTWDSDWVVPLVNDTLSLKELENDSTLTIDASMNYTVDLTRTIANIRLIDSLRIPDTTIVQDYVLGVSSITVPPGYTIVNQIEEHDISMPDNIQLKKVRVDEGVIRVKIYNPIATTAFFTVELPGVTKDGVEFSEDYSAPPAVGGNPGIAVADLDISGSWLDLSGEFGNTYNVLQSKVIVTSSSTGPSVVLTSADVIKVEATFKDVKLDYAKGYFGHQVYQDTVSSTFDILDVVESGSLDLPGTNLQFEIENGLKLNARATLLLVKNTNKLGNTVNLSSPAVGNPIYIDPATGSWNSLSPSTELIEFTPANSNLESFLENLGKDLSFGYKLELNPWGNVTGGYDEIFPSSRLKVKVHADLPLTIGMDDLTLRDTFNIDIEQDPDKTRFESGEIVLNATNAFPFQGNVQLYLLDENGQLLHSVTGSSPLQSSVYGSIDTADGLRKMKSEVIFPLTATVLQDLKSIKQACVRVKLNSPDASSNANTAVQIPAGAFVSVKLKANFRLKTVI